MKPINSLTSLVGLCLAAVCTTSCREHTLLSSKLSPANDTAIVQSKSLACVTYTYYDDTMVTSANLGLPIYQAAGSVKDDYFGITTAATYFQIVPDNPGFYFNGCTIDSAVLIMPYSGFTWGDTANTTLTQKYQVYALGDTLGSSEATYFSYTYKPLAATLSDVITVNLHSLHDSVSVSGVMQRPHMRIRLNNAFLRYIDSTADVKASTPGDFTNAFPGICVRAADTRPSAATTALPYFQLDGVDAYSRAGVVVYYHTNGKSDANTAQYYFNTANCSHFNNIVHSYSHYPVANLYAAGQANDSIIAMQNLPGASIDLVIQHLLDSLPSNIVLNQAQVQISLLPQYTSSVFFAPLRIFPVGINANGLYGVADIYLSSEATIALIDGYAHNFTSNNTANSIITYTINIPREVQSAIATHQNTLHLHINGSEDFFGAYRMVAGGGNYSDARYRAKLFVVYSKLSK